MSLVGKDSATIRGKQSGIILVILGGDTGGPAIWSKLLGTFGRNCSDGGEYPCGILTLDHSEAYKT